VTTYGVTEVTVSGAIRPKPTREHPARVPPDGTGFAYTPGVRRNEPAPNRTEPEMIDRTDPTPATIPNDRLLAFLDDVATYEPAPTPARNETGRQILTGAL
jgi:hypothetical protein